MIDDESFLDGYKKLSKATMDPEMDRQIWNHIEFKLHSEPTVLSKSRRRWRSTRGSLIAACVAILLVVVGGMYTSSHLARINTTQPEAATVSPTNFSLSFVPEPSQVPSWLDNGNGMVLSVTIHKWQPPTDNHTGYYVIVPTTTDPFNVVSMEAYLDGRPEPQGFTPTWSGGPVTQTNAINAYLRAHHLATLSLRALSVLTPRGNTQNINFELAMGSANGAKLQPSTVRLAILKLQEAGDSFRVLGSRMFSPSSPKVTWTVNSITVSPVKMTLDNGVLHAFRYTISMTPTHVSPDVVLGQSLSLYIQFSGAATRLLGVSQASAPLRLQNRATQTYTAIWESVYEPSYPKGTLQQLRDNIGDVRVEVPPSN